MGAIHYAMTDIYGGYAGTTEMTVPDNDDKQALVDTSNAQNVPVVASALAKASNLKMYLGIALVLILVVVIGGRM